MPDSLNSALALAKQSFDELLRLVAMDELARGEFGSGAKRDRVVELLRKLNTHIVSIQRCLGALVMEGNSPPILTLPTTHREFWKEVLEPNATSLQRAYFKASGQEILAELLDLDFSGESPRSTKLNAVTFALERWSDILEEGESFKWLERGFDIEGARDIVAMSWFTPDAWSENLHSLGPVVVDRPANVMQEHVRYRLLEIYRAFTFGLWMSAVALSRSLVEFSLRSNASRFNVALTFEINGRVEDKSLKRLGEEFTTHLPEIAKHMEVVRDTGNRILHPKKRDVIAHPKVMREEALECIQAASAIVEKVYSNMRRN